MVGNIVGCNGGGSACLVSSKEWSSVLAGRLGAGPAAPCRRLFRGGCGNGFGRGGRRRAQAQHAAGQLGQLGHHLGRAQAAAGAVPDRKSTRLNSSHSQISYAVFCLKKKKQNSKDQD